MSLNLWILQEFSRRCWQPLIAGVDCAHDAHTTGDT
jgi:hypothetical protein